MGNGFVVSGQLDLWSQSRFGKRCNAGLPKSNCFYCIQNLRRNLLVLVVGIGSKAKKD